VIERRQFLKTIGISGSAALLEQCAPTPTDELIPYLVAPDNVVPGVASYYATTCRQCPAGCGAIVKTMNGRITKAEGNPAHPISRGRLCVRGQAAVQSVYNPDRFRTPIVRDAHGVFQPISWADAESLLAAKLRAAMQGGADRVAWIGELLTGALDTLTSAWLSALDSRRRLFYETFDYEPLVEAGDIAFGRREVPRYELDRAAFIVSFGAEFLETWLSNVEFTNGYARARRQQLRDPEGTLLVVAPRLSLTGLNADAWIAPRPGSEALVALAMAHAIVGDGLAHPSAGADLRAIESAVAPYSPERVAGAIDVDAATIRRMARRFASARPSLAIGGGVSGSDRHAVQLELACLLLNVLAGNVGESISYGAAHAVDRLATRREILETTRAMASGAVDVLLVHHANPIFTLPPPVGFADALARVPFVVSFAGAPDETTDRAHLVLPDHHFLESWGDYAPRAGVASLLQPAAAPLFDTRATGDVLIEVANQITADTARAVGSTRWADYVRSAWSEPTTANDQAAAAAGWEAALHSGGRFEAADAVRPTLRDVARALVIDPDAPAAADTYTFIACPSTHFYDGRGANESWLQEVPDPIAKISWGDWIEIHPDAARRLGIVDGDVVRVTSSHGQIEAAAHLYAGMRPDVIAMPLGYGRSRSSRHAGARGSNAALLLPPEAAGSPHAVWRASGVRVERAGPRRIVIMLQAHVASREDTSAPLGKIVDPARTDVREPPEHAPVDLFPPHEHPAHRWGMAIDLNSCTGCNACVAACYAENNVAVVGEQFCAQGREMSWIRIERHAHAIVSESGLRRPATVFLPMLCQHCDEAPCEAVCPVYATYHNPEGLNAQVYARCIGTRFCSNNCPYKVRRFNWARIGWDAPLGEQLNPDVTVRSAGVMEKCTFCIQRIQAAKRTAKLDGRSLRDGDVVPACAQTCPAEAIVFGDLHDPQSRVSRLSADPRGYHVLEELNTRPAITYLRRSVPGAPADER